LLTILAGSCPPRGLKKAGTKQQLIDRLLASTADLPDGSAEASPSAAAGGGGARSVDGDDDSIEGAFDADDDLSSEADLDDPLVAADGDRAAPAPPRRRPFGESGLYGLSSVAGSAAAAAAAAAADYRPTGEALEAIINAPRMIRRAGVSSTRQSSKLDKYEPDRVVRACVRA
jgi:hypothetical protein